MAPPQQKKPYLRGGRRESATDFYNLESDSQEKDTVWSGQGADGPQPVAEEKRSHTDRPENDATPKHPASGGIADSGSADQPEVRHEQTAQDKSGAKPSQAEGDRETVEEDLEEKRGSKD